MGFTFEELKHKTVGELRDIAAGIPEEAVQGYSQLNKEHLLSAICKALHIDMFVHHHVESSFNKGKVKQELKNLKTKRDQALKTGDHKDLKELRRRRHKLNRDIRKHTD